MGAHPLPQDLLIRRVARERGAVLVLEEPRRGLAVPDQHVAVDADVVRLGEVHQLGRLRARGERAVGVVPRVGLHVVLGGDLREVPGQYGSRRPCGLTVVDRDAERERDRVLQRWLGGGVSALDLGAITSMSST